MTCSSIYELGQIAIATGMKLSEVARQRVGHDAVDMEYDPIYSGQSEWRLLPAIDHPEDPARLPALRHGPHPSRQRARIVSPCMPAQRKTSPTA
jgi:hypothetical protein